MKRFLQLSGIIAVFSVFLLGAGVGPKQTVRPSFTEEDGTSWALEPLNGTPQTSVFEVDGLRFVTFYVAFVRNAADNVTMNCNVGYSSTTVTYPIQSTATVAGVGTMSNFVPTKAVTGSTSFPITVDIEGYTHMQCSFSGVNSTATDTLGLVIAGGTR